MFKRKPLTEKELNDFQDKCYFYKKKTTIRAVKMKEAFSVKTKEGTMTGKAGDYLAFGIEWEPYIIDNAIFKKTYASHTATCKECGMKSSSQNDFTMHHIETGH